MNKIIAWIELTPIKYTRNEIRKAEIKALILQQKTIIDFKLNY